MFYTIDLKVDQLDLFFNTNSFCQLINRHMVKCFPFHPSGIHFHIMNVFANLVKFF